MHVSFPHRMRVYILVQVYGALPCFAAIGKPRPAVHKSSSQLQFPLNLAPIIDLDHVIPGRSCTAYSVPAASQQTLAVVSISCWCHRPVLGQRVSEQRMAPSHTTFFRI